MPKIDSSYIGLKGALAFEEIPIQSLLSSNSINDRMPGIISGNIKPSNNEVESIVYALESKKKSQRKYSR